MIKSDNVHKVPVTLVCGKCSVNLYLLKSQAGIAQAGKDSRILSPRTPQPQLCRRHTEIPWCFPVLTCGYSATGCVAVNRQFTVLWWCRNGLAMAKHSIIPKVTDSHGSLVPSVLQYSELIERLTSICWAFCTGAGYWPPSEMDSEKQHVVCRACTPAADWILLCSCAKWINPWLLLESFYPQTHFQVMCFPPSSIP